MKTTLKSKLKDALADYASQERREFIMLPTHYGQIVATVAQIMWTQLTEEAIQLQGNNPFSLEDHVNMNIKQLDDCTELVRGELSDLKRKVVVALITVDVHARDIIDELKVDNVSSTNDFKWIKQLKYYWEDDKDPNGECYIR
jgi:dynein heavy chain